MDIKLPRFKEPRTLAGYADALYLTRQERLSVQKVVDELKKRELKLEEHLIKTLPKDAATGVSGRVGVVSLVKKLFPVVVDWDRVHAYVVRTNSWELLQKRLLDSAVREVWDHGKSVPGVQPSEVVKVSLGKVKK